ncbi:MAG: hypothetical protein ACREWI_04160 [Telluria sp.]
MWRELVAARSATPHSFHAKKGLALIWAANLMHGGRKQRDPAVTRWSQVTHYFFDDCAYYTPMLSDPFYGSIAFRQPTNIVTGQLVPSRVAGHVVPPAFVGATTSGATRWKDEAFDPALYLLANPGVAAGVDPAQHDQQHGCKAKRRVHP